MAGGALLTVAIGITGCRSSADQKVIPTPAPHVATTPPGRAGVISVLSSFDRAVVIRAMTSARSYLSPALAAQAPPMGLASLLGLQDIPRSARYSDVHVNGRRATANLTLRTRSQAVTDGVTLLRRGGTWRISAIRGT